MCSVEGGDQMLWSPLMLSPILGAPELTVPGEFTEMKCGEEAADRQSVISLSNQGSLGGKHGFLYALPSQVGQVSFI